jgi:hypothetical protein
MALSQVLTYEGGGDLLNLLVERDTFEEDFTRFYVAEVRIESFPGHTSKLPLTAFCLLDGAGDRINA